MSSNFVNYLLISFSQFLLIFDNSYKTFSRFLQHLMDYHPKELVTIKFSYCPILNLCLRPYRHNLAQKDEIERQVSKMLSSGVIQPSTSAYSSPALLVKKTDGTWRVCDFY